MVKYAAVDRSPGVLEAGERQTEMVEPMVQRLPSDGDAKLAHVGEVGKAEPTRLMLLPEHDILLMTVHGPPSSNAPLQRSTHALADLRMATARMPGAAVSIGTISLSHIPAGSGRRRPRGAFF